MKIVDSAGWIEFIGNGPLAPEYRKYILRSEDLLTPTVVMYEVHKYILRKLGADAAWDATSMMMETTLVSMNDSLATSAANMSIEHKLPMADAIIYATAVAYDATIVTSDAHFTGLPLVKYIPHIQSN